MTIHLGVKSMVWLVVAALWFLNLFRYETKTTSGILGGITERIVMGTVTFPFAVLLALIIHVCYLEFFI